MDKSNATDFNAGEPRYGDGSRNKIILPIVQSEASMCADDVAFDWGQTDFAAGLAGQRIFKTRSEGEAYRKGWDEASAAHRIAHPAAAAAAPRAMLLTQDHAERKATPICTGVLDYFPLAMAYVARISKAGNEQHHPGKPLHWDKTKSTDHADCIARHLIDRGTVDPTDGLSHSGKLAWRALALLETELGNGSRP